MKIKIVVAILLSMCAEIVNAQLPQLSQQYSNPLFLNPAFCGESKGTRFMLNARNQWSGAADGYRTCVFGADHYSYGMRSGIGMSAWRDVAGVNRLAFTHLSAYFAHKVKISRTSGIKMGIRLSHVMRSVDTSRMLFADQVARDNAATSIEPNLMENVSYQLIGAGMVYLAENWWGGVALDNLNRPNTSLMSGGDVQVPIRMSFHGGGIIHQAKGRHHESLRLLFEYKTAQEWDQFDIGAHYKYEQFMMGMWYRGLPLKSYQPGYSNHDAIIILAGAEIGKGLRMGYSFDMTISRLSMQSGGAHEISLLYEIPGKRKRKIFVPPCMQW